MKHNILLFLERIIFIALLVIVDTQSQIINSLQTNCFYNEAGTVNVTLGGNMVIDEYGVLWMDFEILKHHASGTVKAGSAGAPPQVYPFSPPDITHQIRILTQDGSELIMPVPGATSWHFKWILHITFSR